MSASQLLKEWFDHESWWFDSNADIDVYLSLTYAHLLDTTSVINQHTNILEILLVYDQLPRHIERACRDQGYKHIIQYYLYTKALPVAEKWIDGAMEHDWSVMTASQIAFILLPMRHTNDPMRIVRVLDIAWRFLKCYALDLKSKEMMKRFIKATYSRFPKDFKVQYEFMVSPCFINNPVEISYRDLGQIIDKTNLHYKADNVLTKRMLDITRKFIKDYKLQGKFVMISISGGVDSMVASHIFSTLAKEYNIKVAHLHINYSNRPNMNDMEETLLIRWCHQMNSQLVVRRIKEINRADCMEYDMRDIYESYTKHVRFSSYKCLSPTSEPPYVVMGHNHNDCFENILTNITCQSHYDDLIGMEPCLNVQDIMFLRPFLDIPKEEMYAYANKHNIPYLVDSTPTWSQRGLIRDHVIPALEKFNQQAIPSFFHLTSHMKDMYKIIDSSTEMFFNTFNVHHEDCFQACVEVRTLQTAAFFWRELIQKRFQPAIPHKFIKISQKSLQGMSRDLDIFKANVDTYNVGHTKKIVLNKHTMMTLRKSLEHYCYIMIDFDRACC